MANTFPAGPQIDVVMESALRAFEKGIGPLTGFSTSFSDVQLRGTNKMQVAYYPLETAASIDFNGTYATGNTTTEAREITIDKRKYQSMSITSEEYRRQPWVDWELHGQIKGEKLLQDVTADILSIVTAANYPTVASSGAASAFDSSDVAVLRREANEVPWPKDGRILVLDTEYDYYFLEDNNVKLTYAVGSSGTIVEGNLPRVLGFDYSESPYIPLNDGTLKGFMAYRSAILIGFSPIEPHPTVRAQMTDYRKVSGANGITLEYREWGEPITDRVYRIIEANYGYAVGEAAALQRVTT